MFKRFLYFIAIAFVVFLIGGGFLPRLVHVERSIEINRPASSVFELLNGYRSFTSWSPWSERDPAVVLEFSGPESGVGAHMKWSGDPRLVGSGWQEITESQPNSLVRADLFFDQQGPAEIYFQLQETAQGVSVTWGFDTDLTEGQGMLGGILARYFGLFFDKWIGTDYEQGLANLKEVAESVPIPAPEPDSPRPEIEIIDAMALEILYIDNAKMGPALNLDEMTQNLASSYQEISLFMDEHDIGMSAAPMAITRGWNEVGLQFSAAIPVHMKPVTLSGRVRSGQSPSGPAVRLVHYGPYAGMAASYEILAAYMAAHDLPEGDVSWEHYISDPGETAPDELITHIYFQVGNTAPESQ